MGFFSLLYPWGLILQAVAIVHFIRRRPDSYWFFVILFLGPLGAIAYIAMEMVPDLGLLSQAFEAAGRRRRIRMLEAIVQDNPATGNFEELGALYLENGRYAEARDSYDKAITPRDDQPDPIYRRAIARIELGEFAEAVRDLEHVTGLDPKYDLKRAIALLAHACAKTGQPERAEELFQQAVSTSTLSETYYHYALFLAAEGRYDEARDYAGRILAKKPTMPGYLRRRERPWFRKASALLKRLPA
jgi:hypothetical protein